MNFFTLALKNLLHRPMRTLLTIFGIAIAIGGYIALSGLASGIESTWMRGFLDSGTHIVVVRKGTVDMLSGSLDERLSEQLKLAPGVKAVAGELIDMTPLDSGGMLLFRGWKVGSFPWRSLDLTAGGLPQNGTSSGAIIGKSLALRLNKEPMDKINFFGGSLSISGIAKTVGAIGNNSIMLPLKSMQSMLGRPGQVSLFNIQLDDTHQADHVSQVLQGLASLFPGLTFIESERLAQENQFLTLWRGMAWATSLIALVMGFVIIVNTLLFSVSERRRELGILRAIGWSSQRILQLIVLESLVLCLIGGIFGIILGVATLDGLAQSPMLRGFFDWSITLSVILQVFGSVIVLGLFGSAYPAWKAIRQHPLDALRYE